MYGLGALLRGDRGFIANYLINFRGRAQSRLLGVKTRARLWGFIVERRSQAPFVYSIWYVCVCALGVGKICEKRCSSWRFLFCEEAKDCLCAFHDSAESE